METSTKGALDTAQEQREAFTRYQINASVQSYADGSTREDGFDRRVIQGEGGADRMAL